MHISRQNVWHGRGQTAWLLGLLTVMALAAPSLAGAQAAPAEAALLERIRLLERRLAQLERAQAPQRPPRPVAQPAAQAPPPPAPPPPPTARVRDPNAEEIPQEAFVFRDQAVTLRPGRAELSLDLGYLRDRRTVSSDRSFSAIATGRIGLLEGVEASVTVPFFQSTRSFDLTPALVVDRETRGLGDVALQLNMLGWGERPAWPGAIFTAAVVTPTGPSPFINPVQGLSAQQVPVDITQLISARGTWALRGGVQFFKTVDPLVIFGGASYEYAFPLDHAGITFRPGWRINYNAGISFALSERSTLGFTFIGSYTAALRANAISYRGTASEAAIFRLSLVQRLGAGFWLEPALAMGLVTESPSFQVGLGLRYRF